MEDFNSFSAKNSQSKNANLGGEKYSNEKQNILNLVSSLARKYDGKSKTELFRAVYEEAKKGKMKGTLTNSDIDNFVNLLSPFLDDKMKKALNKVVEEIKKI